MVNVGQFEVQYIRGFFLLVAGGSTLDAFLKASSLLSSARRLSLPKDADSILACMARSKAVYDASTSAWRSTAGADIWPVFWQSMPP